MKRAPTVPSMATKALIGQVYKDSYPFAIEVRSLVQTNISFLMLISTTGKQGIGLA